MILEINTTDREKISLTLLDKKAEKYFEFKTKDQSADLLVAINKVLKKNKISLQNLKAIVVKIGPGSFTGVRVGVTVANTLSWTLDIPVIGYKEGERDKISGNKFLKSVIPYYEIL